MPLKQITKIILMGLYFVFIASVKCVNDAFVHQTELYATVYSCEFYFLDILRSWASKSLYSFPSSGFP